MVRNTQLLEQPLREAFSSLTEAQETKPFNKSVGIQAGAGPLAMLQEQRRAVERPLCAVCRGWAGLGSGQALRQRDPLGWLCGLVLK